MKYMTFMDFKKLSIKNFIGDLPNILNKNFEMIENFINKIFTGENGNTLKIKNIEADGQITCSTLTASNIKIYDNGKLLSFAELIDRLEALESSNKSNESEPAE